MLAGSVERSSNTNMYAEDLLDITFHFAIMENFTVSLFFLAFREASRRDFIEGHATKVARSIMEKGYQLFTLVCHSHL